MAKFLYEVGSGSTSNPVQFISFSKKSVLEKDSPSAAPLSMKNPLVYISIKKIIFKSHVMYNEKYTYAAAFILPDSSIIVELL